MRQGNQTVDGPFWAEHFYEPCKAGMIDASSWAVYAVDPKTGEKVLVGWEVHLPFSLRDYAIERLAIIRERLKRTSIERMIKGDFFHEAQVGWDATTVKTIKNALKQGEKMTRAQEIMKSIIEGDDTVSKEEKQKLIDHIHDGYDYYKPIGWSDEKIFGFIITGYVPGLMVDNIKLLLSKERSPKYVETCPGFLVEI